MDSNLRNEIVETLKSARYILVREQVLHNTIRGTGRFGVLGDEAVEKVTALINKLQCKRGAENAHDASKQDENGKQKS